MTVQKHRSQMIYLCSAALMTFGVLMGIQAIGSAEADPHLNTEAQPWEQAAREIDRLVQVNLKQNKLSPNKMTSDATFLRRVYLDVIGRIPDIKETRAFHKSKNPNKRKELVGTLMNSPGYVSHNFNFWADILRIKSRPIPQISGEPFIHWIKESLQENKPYDVMVREMLITNGAANEKGNGATGYLLRDRGMPLDSMANTVRVFLGTRIECAQCHNHPFTDWTQRQFFEMAAFFGGVQYVNEMFTKPEGRKLLRQSRMIGKQQGEQAARNLRRQLRRVLQPGITNSGTGVARLPNDYAYDDGKPNDFVLAKTIFGKPAAINPKVPKIPRRFAERMKKAKNKKRMMSRTFAKDIQSRDAFATWLTDDENPLFTTVIVNRMWAKLMGAPLVPVVDDMREDGVSVNPALSAHLNQVMKDLNYDLKAFQTVILLSKTYQRVAETSLPQAPERFRFPGPLSRRMSAEQFWDSMLTLVVPNIDSTITEPMSIRAKAVYDNFELLSGKSTEEIIAQFKGPNGSMMSQQERRRTKRTQMREKVRPLRRALVQARRRKDKKAEAEALAGLKTLGIDADKFLSQQRYGRELLRASELTSPTPPGHFLREFGQSDRDQANGASTAPTVPQVLNLVNGFVEKNLLAKKQGMMLSALRRTKKTDQKIRLVYLFVLNRQPSRAEIAAWRSDAAKIGEPAIFDLIWTLVNSHEFRQLS